MPANDFESDLARAERVAKLLLNTKTQMRFETIGAEGIFSYGKQRASYNFLECDWSELLRWWCMGDSVGFITVKTTKTPQMAVVGPGEEVNIAWFDLYKH